MKINLSGKTALVCGSSAGIGQAIAMEFAKAGARIILLARNPEKLKQVADALEAHSEGHVYYAADFNSNEDVAHAVQEIAKNYNIDILVNNTGGPPAGPAHLAQVDEYLTAFKNHLINNQILAQALVPGMKSRSWGRIINIISTSVKIPLHNLGVSNTIRGAVGNWSKTLANELAASGITVNNVLPGATETDRLGAIISGKSQKLGLTQDHVTQEMLAEIPAGRFGKPEEIAYAACFLASEQAAYITGTNMVVDGGRTGNL